MLAAHSEVVVIHFLQKKIIYDSKKYEKIWIFAIIIRTFVKSIIISGSQRAEQQHCFRALS